VSTALATFDRDSHALLNTRPGAARVFRRVRSAKRLGARSAAEYNQASGEEGMYFRQVFGVVLLINFGIAILTAQNKPITSGGPAGSVGNNNAGTLGNTPLSTTPNLNSSTNSTTTTDVPHPILITGKVTLDDGSKPGQPVLLERICGGRPHAEGYTDPSGSFSIRLGQEMDVIADASEAPPRNTVTSGNPQGGIRDRDLATCDLRAVLAGYRSENVPLAAHKYMDNPDIGTIVMRRLGAVEGLTMSATTALAPKDAHKAFEKGLEEVRKSKFEDAEKEFGKAVEIYPKFAAAWYELGRVQERRDHEAEARNSYTQSIAADSKYINPYERLSIIAFHEAKWQEVADSSDRVLHLDPYDYPGAYYYNAVANLQLKNLVPAERSAREALKMDVARGNPQIYYVLGIILAQKQDYSGAVENLRAYLKVAPDAKDVDKVRKQLGDIEKTLEAKSGPAQQ
jgi:tetratricopeptide (TPR) repeat protein